jgi:aerobic-type carbon monoxide dehydrogenase small subunit (CoxS/CutS family)
MAEGKEVKKKGISRRDFIKGTGLAVGGVAISSTVLGVACAPANTTVTNPLTTPPTGTPNPTAPAATTTAPPPTTTQPTGTTPSVVNENLHFTLNGNPVAVKVQDWWTLNYVLREPLGMTAQVKYACDEGICGFCTVIKDNKVQLSCMTLAVECEGADILTVDSLRDKKTGKLHAIQQGFIQESGFMCGLCTTGQIMAAKNLLDRNPNPTIDDVRLNLSNNLCLCGGYDKIQKSVLTAATLLKGG